VAEQGEGDEDNAPDARPSAVDTGRVLALSDGVFAIAGTLLVLDLKLPISLNDRQLRAELVALVPSLRAYVISYALIGLFWYGHHAQFRRIKRLSARVVILNLVLLGTVTLMPFTTQLLSQYGSDHLSGVFYAANMAAILLLEGVIGWITLYHHDAVGPADGGTWDNMVIKSMTSGAVFLVSVPIGLAYGTGDASYTWLALPVIGFVRHRVTRYVEARRAVPR
jgi:uncharacterized membrane protein